MPRTVASSGDATRSKGSQGPQGVSRLEKENSSDCTKKRKVVRVITVIRRVSYPGKAKGFSEEVWQPSSEPKNDSGHPGQEWMGVRRGGYSVRWSSN